MNLARMMAIFANITSARTPFREDKANIPDYRMAMSHPRIDPDVVKRVQTVTITAPCFSNVRLIAGFSNLRRNYIDINNHSTNKCTELVSQAILFLEQRLDDSNGEKTEGIIILSLLDMLTFSGLACLANLGTVAKAVRLTTAVIDTVLKNSNFKLVIVSPYVYASQFDLAKLVWTENKLLQVLGADPDIAGHLYKRIRIFSVLQHCNNYVKIDPSPNISALDELMENKGIRHELSPAGSEYIGIRLSETICHWVSKKRIPSLNILNPPHASAENLECVIKQTSGANQMVVIPGHLSNNIREIPMDKVLGNLWKNPTPPKHESRPKTVQTNKSSPLTTTGPLKAPSSSHSATAIPNPKAYGSQNQKMGQPRPDGGKGKPQKKSSASSTAGLPASRKDPSPLTGPKATGSGIQERAESDRSVTKGKSGGSTEPENPAPLTPSDPAPPAPKAPGWKNQVKEKPDPAQRKGRVSLTLNSPAKKDVLLSLSLADPTSQAPKASGTKLQTKRKSDPPAKKGKVPVPRSNPAPEKRPDPTEGHVEVSTPQPILPVPAPKASGPKNQKKKQQNQAQGKKTSADPQPSAAGSTTTPKWKKKKKKSQRKPYHIRSLMNPHFPYSFPGTAGRERNPWFPPPAHFPPYASYMPPQFY